MNKEEALKIAMAMKIYYPRDFKGESKEEQLFRVSIIQNNFNNIPYEVVNKALDELMQENPKWCPSLPELLIRAKEIEKKILTKRLNQSKNPYTYDEKTENFIVNKDYEEELIGIETEKIRLIGKVKETSIYGLPTELKHIVGEFKND